MHEPIAPKRKYLHRPKPGLVYFRAGKIRVQLPADETSAEFDRLYNQLLAGVRAPKPRLPTGARKTVAPVSTAPTIGWVIERYKASDYFAAAGKLGTKVRPLRPNTQSNYHFGFKLMHKAGLTETSLLDLNPSNAKAYILKIKQEHSGSTALVQKYLLSNLWTFAVDELGIDVGAKLNPMREVKNPYTVRQDHKPWPDHIQDRFLEVCNDDLRLAFFLLFCTGQRVGDVIRLKWSDFDGSHIRLVQQKDRAGDQLTVSVPNVLIEELQARPRAHEYILTHAWGRPWASGASLYHRFKKVLRAIGGGDLTIHGLRKNAGIMLAMNGATVPVIMAALGHKSEKMALYYIRLANQSALADQAGAIFDRAFAARVKARRAALRVVK